MIHQAQIGENLIKEARSIMLVLWEGWRKRRVEKDRIVWRNFIKTKNLFTMAWSLGTLILSFLLSIKSLIYFFNFCNLNYCAHPLHKFLLNLSFCNQSKKSEKEIYAVASDKKSTDLRRTKIMSRFH